MRSSRVPRGVASLAAFSLLSVACADSPAPTEPDELAGRIVITNDESVLAERVRGAGGVDVPLVGTPGDNTMLRTLAAPPPPTFKLSALVTAPSSAGRSLLATHVALRGDMAYVSYMTPGETALGAVEVFDIKDPANPRLVSQALLANTDVTALAVDGKHVYLATAAHDFKFRDAAVLERLQLQGGKLTSASERIGLPSFVATSVSLSGSQVFVTSGNGGPGQGGLTVLDGNKLTVVKSDVFLDARAVSDAQGPRLVVSQGSPARLRIYDANRLTLSATVALSGGTLPDAKSSVMLAGDWAFVATGDGGVQVVDVSRGTLNGALPRPPAPSGALANESVTNALSLAQDLVLTADGAAGVAVAWSDHRSRRSGERVSVQSLGRLGLGGSANYVASTNTALFVASGAAGLRILTIQ